MLNKAHIKQLIHNHMVLFNSRQIKQDKNPSNLGKLPKLWIFFLSFFKQARTVLVTLILMSTNEFVIIKTYSP